MILPDDLRRGRSEVLVFDVGGTYARAGIYVAPGGLLLATRRWSAPSHLRLPDVEGPALVARMFDMMAEIGHDLMDGRLPDLVALAFPGPVDIYGAALAAPTLWGNKIAFPVSVKEPLQRLWPSSKVLALNDMTASGFRYLRTRDDDLCVLTISSGIGHKVFVGGRPLLGPRSRGGEIGHLRVDMSSDALVCDCGGSGHLAAVSSGRATSGQALRLFANDPGAFLASGLGQQASGDIGRVTNEAVVHHFKECDPWTVALVRRMTLPLGQAIAAIHLAVGTERFVIIGGFALSLGEKFRRELVTSAARCAWDVAGDWDTMIELGHLDDDSGLIGAGRCAAWSIEASE